MTHIQRWLWRGGRDPIAVFTFVLLLIGVLQFEISRRSAKRQLRAYVFVEGANVLDGATNNPPIPQLTNVPGIHLVVKNSGQTPAYDVVHWAEIRVLPHELEDTLRPPQPLGRASVSVIPSQGTITKTLVYSHQITASEIADIASGKICIFVYGRLQYIDAFKRKRFTNYRLKYFGVYPPVAGHVMLFCDNGNVAN